jgi:hypothetical protein
MAKDIFLKIGRTVELNDVINFHNDFLDFLFVLSFGDSLNIDLNLTGFNYIYGTYL